MFAQCFYNGTNTELLLKNSGNITSDPSTALKVLNHFLLNVTTSAREDFPKSISTDFHSDPLTCRNRVPAGDRTRVYCVYLLSCDGWRFGLLLSTGATSFIFCFLQPLTNSWDIVYRPLVATCPNRR